MMICWIFCYASKRFIQICCLEKIPNPSPNWLAQVQVQIQLLLQTKWTLQIKAPLFKEARALGTVMLILPSKEVEIDAIFGTCLSWLSRTVFINGLLLRRMRLLVSFSAGRRIVNRPVFFLVFLGDSLYRHVKSTFQCFCLSFPSSR